MGEPPRGHRPRAGKTGSRNPFVERPISLSILFAEPHSEACRVKLGILADSRRRGSQYCWRRERAKLVLLEENDRKVVDFRDISRAADTHDASIP